MKAKKKPVGIKHRIREEGKREERIGLALLAALLIAIISISGFLINSVLISRQPIEPNSSVSEPRAAIVDQLSLTYPNQTFTNITKSILEHAGFKVDYYPGEDVRVEFYRNLPTHNYSLIILREHSTATDVGGKKGSVSFFTSERFIERKYFYELVTDQLVSVMYSDHDRERGITYFGIFPAFVRQSMRGRFQNTIIIMMGCQGLDDPSMAKAFVEKGAKSYISWDESVLASQTDQATTFLLQHLVTERQTIEQAVTETNKEVGPDPSYKSLLVYYPPEAGNYAIQTNVGNFVTGTPVVQSSN